MKNQGEKSCEIKGGSQEIAGGIMGMSKLRFNHQFTTSPMRVYTRNYTLILILYQDNVHGSSKGMIR